MTSNTQRKRIEHIRVAAEEVGERLDRYLARKLPELSRTRIQELIAEGHVLIAGNPARSSHKTLPGESLQIEVTPRPPLAALPEEIPVEVLYEDSQLIVVNKPAGMVVHSGPNQTRGTLVNALLHRFGSLAMSPSPERPGIVHRLDRGTSGAMVVARTDEAHRILSAQFAARDIEKVYLALVHGRFAGDSGTIRLPVGRDIVRRTRMTTKRREGRPAHTDWRVLARIGNFTLLEVRLHTGRTHQIRVHMAAEGHPVVGDMMYGAPRHACVEDHIFPVLGRSFLHSARLAFNHPATGERITVLAPLDPALCEFLAKLADATGTSHAVIDAALRGFL